ncbi:MAG: competence protein ComEC [Parcubacteria bacterium C7867-005]|nr:MAG: competence protein ComEC [Parcubacteria bacterium C7867-005]
MTVGFLGFLFFKFIKIEANILISLLFLVIFSFGFGALRFEIKDYHLLDKKFEASLESKIELDGLVISEVETRESGSRFVLDVDGQKILVSARDFSNTEYGDRVAVTGKLQKPGIIESDTGRDFDYGAYLSKDDIYYTMSFAEVETLSSGHGNFLKSFLIKIKTKFTDRMNTILPEPESSLLAGLLVSGKQALPKSTLEEFKRAGIVHIVVLSGYNVTIIAEFFRKMFGLLSVRFALPASVVGIVLFTLLTGASATVVRASIMVLIVLFSKSLGRTYSVGRALLLAGVLMVFHNPKILVFDPSFELSFIAVLALAYMSSLAEKYLGSIPLQWGMRSMLATIISTQVAVLPYLLYSMGSFSMVSVFSNTLILLFIPVTMLIGFAAVSLSFVGFYLAMPFSYCAHLLLEYILSVAHYLGNLSFASISVPIFPWWLAVFIYLVLIGFVYNRSKT